MDGAGVFVFVFVFVFNNRWALPIWWAGQVSSWRDTAWRDPVNMSTGCLAWEPFLSFLYFFIFLSFFLFIVLIFLSSYLFNFGVTLPDVTRSICRAGCLWREHVPRGNSFYLSYIFFIFLSFFLFIFLSFFNFGVTLPDVTRSICPADCLPWLAWELFWHSFCLYMGMYTCICIFICIWQVMADLTRSICPADCLFWIAWELFLLSFFFL